MTNISLLSYKQIFSYAAKLFTFRLRALLLLTGIFQLLLSLGGKLFTSTQPKTWTIWVFLLSFLCGQYLFAAVVLMLKSTVEKEDAPLSEIFRRAGRKYWPLLGATTVLFMAVALSVVLLLGFSGVGYAINGKTGIMLTLALAGLVWFVLIMAAMIYFHFYNFAIVFDNTPLWKSFAYSIRLVKGNFWYVLGFMALLSVIILLMTIFAGVCNLLFMLLTVISAALAQGLGWLVSFAVNVICLAFMQSATTVFYLNLTGRLTNSAQAEPDAPARQEVNL